jgi:hypothetical protein
MKWKFLNSSGVSATSYFFRLPKTTVKINDKIMGILMIYNQKYQMRGVQCCQKQISKWAALPEISKGRGTAVIAALLGPWQLKYRANLTPNQQQPFFLPDKLVFNISGKNNPKCIFYFF